MSTFADLPTTYAGTRGRLFGLALKTSLLTVLTLGLYRFWMKTRLRRFYWSAVRPGGQPLEYTGEPLEKLLGFLIAVVFLAFYIGLVNLILVFFSFAFLQDNAAAYLLSFAGLVPLWFYARYRARRYILARTRWRGIRLGQKPGAWGYAGRALLHWGITILSAGLLWPRMTFALEKFRTDRTTFGTETMTQGGGWGMLFPAFIPAYLAAMATAGSIALGIFLEDPAWFTVSVLSIPILAVSAVHYNVTAFRRMAATKSVAGAGFRAMPRTWRVFWIYGFGNVLAFMAIILVMFAAGFLLSVTLATMAGGSGGFFFDLNDPSSLTAAGVPFWIGLTISLLFYFSFFIFWGVLRQVFVTLPLMRHYSETLTITGVAGLLTIRQTDRDHFAEAEGFAEALDVGAAI